MACPKPIEAVGAFGTTFFISLSPHIIILLFYTTSFFICFFTFFLYFVPYVLKDLLLLFSGSVNNIICTKSVHQINICTRSRRRMLYIQWLVYSFLVFVYPMVDVQLSHLLVFADYVLFHGLIFYK